MKFILGTKQKMTQVFDEASEVHPVTILATGPTTVLQTKTKETDGYNAVQIGFGEQKARRRSKALRGHVKKALGKDDHAFKIVREFRTTEAPEHKIGDTVTVGGAFQPGDMVVVSGLTKGKGFQGGVKRHGFKGGPRSHGQKHSEREPGSIGATGPQKVLKGTKMAGRMGGVRVTVKNLKVLQVNPEENILVLEGAVPGRRGTVIEVRSYE